MLDYLYQSVVDQRVKKNTWEKRLSALKRYLTVQQDIDFASEQKILRDVSYIRSLYDDIENKDLTRIKGKQRVEQEGLLQFIHTLPVREKAICLVNLVTASRPSEMVAMKLQDFDLEGNAVAIYIQKQKNWFEKRLNPITVKAVKDYQAAYRLKGDDYLVGRVYKNGKYESTQVSTEAYRKFLHRTIGLTAYNLRKTQVSSMHEKRADLLTITKQTGHSSTQTLAEHYLNVSDKTVDKFL
ncbi:site-specific integrase [Gracilibacillus salinarum]|uniref:Site-specific integrase n=1 Tax=Gracilibacillus salinarum TaxID=2932255 RepID=A0ABY4GIZ6_9BACI|nr:site-specific integrase [Gracilibacillus salinarum]UOQ84326.1 site-specific integrase [Gracilibacillus salinarum]